MTKLIKKVTDMEIDEISLVDRGANQHALVTIAKRADTEEDSMPDITLFDDTGTALPEDTELEEGQHVWDGDGNEYVFELEEEEYEDEPELAVAKSDPFTASKKSSVAKSYSEQVLEELSKADDEAARTEVLAKAFSRVEELEKRQAEAEELAKAERTLRLEREYIAKAEQYNLPVDADDLGPVLMRMVETMSDADCRVIAKCLESSGDLIYREIGAQGGGDNQDVMSRVSAFATEEIGKSAEAEVVTDIFDANPDAYDMYLAERRG